MVMQIQIKALLTATGERVIEEPNTRSNIEVAKLPVFSREVEKIEGFIIAYRLYLKIKIRSMTMEE